MYYTMYVPNVVLTHASMKTITATNARSDLFNLVKDMVKDSEPLRITSKEGSVVLVSEDFYESLMETAELLSIPGFIDSIKKGEKEIQKGEVYSLDEVL